MYKRTRPISSFLDQTSLVNKGLFIWPKRDIFSCGTNKGNPKHDGALRQPIQSEHRICFILPAYGFRHMTKLNIGHAPVFP